MTHDNDADPLEVALVALLVVAEAVLTLAVMVVALVLTIAGWQPQQQTPEPRPQPAACEPLQPLQQAAPEPQPQPCATPWLPPCWPELEALTVAQLRSAARAAGLPRSLTRNGRRAELLPALAGAALAW